MRRPDDGLYLPSSCFDARTRPRTSASSTQKRADTASSRRCPRATRSRTRWRSSSRSWR